jgi:hypothetical protein
MSKAVPFDSWVLEALLLPIVKTADDIGVYRRERAMNIPHIPGSWRYPGSDLSQTEPQSHLPVPAIPSRFRDSKSEPAQF